MDGGTLEPKQRRIRWQVGIGFLIFLFILAGTILVVLYGNGYRIGVNNGTPKLAKTGILNAASTPRGAEVRINHHLTTATNNTVNLAPGKYTIEITKEGYTPWEKDVIIKSQVVTNTDATLFPLAPALQSIAAVGVENPVLDPSKTKLAFRVASQSAKRNGVYVLDMTARSFPVLAAQSSATQLIDDTLDTFSQATYTWSPDGKQLLASVSGTLDTPTTYLLSATQFNDTPRDVTAILPSIEDQWRTQKLEKEQARLQGLPQILKTLINNDFTIIEWAPDDNKILYQAKTDASLPIVITPRRIGNNPLYEVRTIKKGGIYVYDIKEDVNTKILDTAPTLCEDINPIACPMPLSWFPDSYHLLYVHDKKIDIVEDDGSNTRTVYAGPFVEPYVYPWPDGSKIVIVTNLNNTLNPPTLYTISLR